MLHCTPTSSTMTLQTVDDTRPLDRIQSQNVSEAGFASKEILNRTLIDQEKTEHNNNDTKMRYNRDIKAESSLRVVYFSMMTTMTAIGISVSSTWPFLQKIDLNVSPIYLGWVNFGFYIGAISADLIFGRWMHYRPKWEPLMGSLFLLILSSLISAYAQEMGQSSGLWAIMVSRFFLGMTRGTMTITRAAVTEAKSQDKRSRALANLTMTIAGGFTVGAAIQAAIAQVGENAAYIRVLRLQINLYTIPSYITILLAIVNCCLVIRYIRPQVISNIETEKETMTEEEETLKGKLLASICLIAMFAVLNFTVAVMETLLVPFVQHQFALTRAMAVWYAGLLHTLHGIIAFSQQWFLKILLRRYSDRLLVLIGYGLVCLEFFLYISWGDKYPKLAEPINWNSTMNTTKKDEMTVGCPSQYSWCRTSPQIWLPQFLLGVFVYSVGFSTCLGLIISLYTKILGFKKQGISVSMISACANIGRLSAPIVGSASYVDIGPRYTYSWMCSMMCLALVSYIILYKKMIPKKEEFHLEKTSEKLLESRTNASTHSSLIMYVTPM